MVSADVAAQLDDPVARRLLEGAFPARLAYVATDGTPRVVPVGFVWTGRTIVVGTIPGSAKVRAIEANPAVALTVDTSPPAWPPNALLVRGRATVTVVDGVFPEYVEGARRLTPAEELPAWLQGVHALYDRMARIDIEPTHVTIHDFERRIPQAVRRLAEERFGGG
jgi:hypothetical protein